jgi:hypothetical protein
LPFAVALFIGERTNPSQIAKRKLSSLSSADVYFGGCQHLVTIGAQTGDLVEHVQL